MNITNIRNHIKSLIALIDADLEILEDSFNDKDLTSSETEKGYKITFGATETDEGPNSFIDLLPMLISIYEPSNRDEESSFDSLYTKAYQIRDQIIDPKCGIDEFTKVLPINITPSVLDTSDKTFKMELAFEIRNDFRFN